MKKLAKNRKNTLVKPTSFTVAILLATLMVVSSFVSATGGNGSVTQTINNETQTQHFGTQTKTCNSLLSDAQSAEHSNNAQSSNPAPLGASIVTEGFEGGVMPPTGWTHVQFNPVETWVIDTYQPNSGTYFANCQYDSTYTTTQSEWLITPAMDFTPYDQVFVSFWWFMSYYWGVTPYDNYDLNVKVSTDNGTTWTTVWNEDTLGVFENWVYYDASFGVPVDLSAYTTYSSVKIGFEYNGYDGAGMGLDDINIYGLIVGADDVGVTSINAPATGNIYGPITPTATVKNFGSADQTDVPVDMTITKYGSPINYFSNGFESYTLGYYAFPPGWTNTSINPTGRWFMYASTQTYSASTYPRINEGSDTLAQDEILISPKIDCSALTSVNVIFTKTFTVSPALDATLTIEGSDDDGATWTHTLATYTVSSSTAENISCAWAIGQNDVRIRWRFQSGADVGLASSCYFDNFQVTQIQGWGTYGNSPPAGWTIERKDTTAWDYSHWHKYASTSYDSNGNSARIYYVSPYVEANDNLTSPSIDCSALSRVVLQFNGYFYAYSTYNDKGYVQISVDGGDWQDIDIYQHLVTYGYAYNYEWYNGYDITSLAAGESDVQIRFHFTRPVAATSGYWYVDNVRVGDGAGNFVFCDTFDYGPSAYYTGFKNFVHDNWGGFDWMPISMPHYNNKWQNLLTGTSPTCTPYEGLHMAQYYSYLAYQGEKAMLYSIPINVAAANTLKMQFAMYHDTVVGAAKIEVLASHDGIDWQNLGTYNRNDGSANGWYTHIVSLDGYEDDTALQIAFLATADYVANIYIDAVAVFDPGLITDYTNTTYVDINAGQSVVVAFSTWTPTDWGTLENASITYDVYATTDLFGDQVPDNDAMTKTAILHYPYFYDVSTTLISNPTSGNAQTLPVKAQIKNIGQTPVKTFFVNAKIGSTIYNNLLNEDFESSWGPFGNVPPTGWTITTNEPIPVTWDNNNWHKYAYGGTQGSVARIYYSPIRSQDDSLISPTMDCTGKTQLTLQFWSYLYYYSTATYGYVDGSIDNGATWTQSIVVYHATQTAGVFSYDISSWAANQAQVKVRFRYVDNDGLYWYVDNVKVFAPPSQVTEYNEDTAVTTWLNPGQTRDLTFANWTPANLISPRTSGNFDYTILVTSLNTPDGATTNNALTKTITLTYKHDVGIKSITSPSSTKRDITFVHYDGNNANAVGLTSGGTFEAAARFTPTQVGAYAGYKLTTVMYCHGWIGGTVQPAHSGVLKIYDAGTAILPGTLLYSQAFTSAAGNGWANLTLTTPVTIDGSKDIWVSMEWTHAASQYPAGCDGGPHVPDGDWIYTGTWASLYTASGGAINANWNIRAGLEAGGGPPGVSLYLQPGVQPIKGIANNLGTFVENDLVSSAEIMNYTVNPNGTLDFTATVTDIDLNPFVGEETLDFSTFNFAEEGVYALTVSLPLGDDNAPSNNVKKLGIGIDDTAPVTTHTIAPAAPDGKNGWYVHDVTITLTATDPKVNGVSSGVAKIEYQINGGTWQTYTAPFKVTTESAANAVKYKATDKVGNVEGEKTVPSFKLDKTIPVIAMNYTWEKIGFKKYNIIVTATCSDLMSGMAKVEFYFNGALQAIVNGTGPEFVWTYVFAEMPHVTLKGVAYDISGWSAEATLENPTSQSQSQQSQTSHTVPVLKQLVR